jgi:hypothetical protein
LGFRQQHNLFTRKKKCKVAIDRFKFFESFESSFAKNTSLPYATLQLHHSPSHSSDALDRRETGSWLFESTDSRVPFDSSSSAFSIVFGKKSQLGVGQGPITALCTSLCWKLGWFTRF